MKLLQHSKVFQDKCSFHMMDEQPSSRVVRITLFWIARIYCASELEKEYKNAIYTIWNTSQFKTTKHVTRMMASDWSLVQNITEHNRSMEWLIQQREALYQLCPILQMCAFTKWNVCSKHLVSEHLQAVVSNLYCLNSPCGSTIKFWSNITHTCIFIFLCT